MKYSPKLKKAAEEIKDILKKYDIAGVVVLHTPGFSEYVNALSPSYSCAKFEGNSLRVRANLKEDFKGDKKAWNTKVGDTLNMFSHLAHVTTEVAFNFSEMEEMIKKKVEFINDEPFGHTSIDEINN